MKFVLRPAARADLACIWSYTAGEWGVDQADHYLASINRQIERAVENPGIGGEVFGLPREYRKVRSGSHKIVYRWSETELTVVCVVHEREDVPDEAEIFGEE